MKQPWTVLAGILAALKVFEPGAGFAQSGRPAVTAVKGDPVRGETLYQSCAICHSIDANGVGPMHRGIVGRRAGTIKDYNYSDALKSSGLTWDESILDRWLINPNALVPGSNMFFAIDDAQDRADIIAYLKEQK
jgi:cytochrome c